MQWTTLAHAHVPADLSVSSQHALERLCVAGNCMVQATGTNDLSMVFTAPDTIELSMTYFCQSYGGEAEDALINTLLDALNRNLLSSSVTNIKIIGNKDPCQQCQIKLQRLAQVLQEQLRGTTGANFTICYYSKVGHASPCFCMSSQCSHDTLSTRPGMPVGIESDWLRFEFGGSDFNFISSSHVAINIKSPTMGSGHLIYYAPDETADPEDLEFWTVTMGGNHIISRDFHGF